jgi:hypothetical protein
MRVATKAAATTMETTILTVVEAFVILELNFVLCEMLQGLVYEYDEGNREDERCYSSVGSGDPRGMRPFFGFFLQNLRNPAT